MNSEISKRFYDEIAALGGHRKFYNEDIRKKHPNGINRLAHLVPEVAPDQVALARLLAKFAVEMRKDDFTSGESLQAYQDYVNAKDNKTLIKLLARRALYDPISWEACEQFLFPENRSYIDKTRKPKEKRLDPIPEPIQNLMEQCFRGEVKRPKHTPLDLRKAAIVFAVRVTLEADIKATSGNPCACEIVGDLVGEQKGNVAGFWKDRGERQKRKPKENRDKSH
jgi:hypothetical protein